MTIKVEVLTSLSIASTKRNKPHGLERVDGCNHSPSTRSNRPTNGVVKRPGDRHAHRHSSTKPVIFVDGEGANVGDSIRFRGKSYQKQNYALLTAVFSSGECRRIVGLNGTGRLSTEKCLRFLLDLPRNFIIIGYGIDYDVQQMLYDVPERYMLKLHKYGHVRWHNFILTYKPRKCFSISLVRSKKDKAGSRQVTTWWDIQGFFQTRFDKAVNKWHVATDDEVAFLSRMKDSRSTFSGITQEQIEYNELEGKHGIRVFERVREEWTKLGLPVRRFDGAGAIASAMFRVNKVEEYLHQRNPIDTEVMLRAYLGGRFDYSRQGFIGDSFEYDINSAYPNVATTLPCLSCNYWDYKTDYISTSRSLWHVRWNDKRYQWAPFPFRDKSGRIRYYNSGEGWYYGSEVEAALSLYSGIEVLEGFTLTNECDHRPFEWVAHYYDERQRLKEIKDFGEQVLKFGLNAAYGKCAQSKGFTPRYQCLIWAGMITSGTRGMILDAIRRDPTGISVTATDSVVSKRPLTLAIDPGKLGYWEVKQLENVCVVGNGLYHSIDGYKSGTRGYDKSSIDWPCIRDYFSFIDPPFNIPIPTHTFFGYIPASTQKRWDLRCTWETGTKEMRIEIPSWKRLEDGWLWPQPNPSNECSYPAKIATENLRLDAESEDTVT